ncbi:VPS4-associated protein 1 [Vararia minispora EC-137]|uniref:VPS4-associated protein 1 n=1 Tax=Vararia minispora EC-137 TaxID=1314806 RepID=A0ACB8QR05_9AGAM|nr:VPS4-associated protein 1 [Vararia minispora EC-137]
MSFTNVYYKRTAGTPRPCYVCYKPTQTVLATVGTVDFLYTCDSHLADSGFVTRIMEPTKESAVSAEVIAKIKEEYEAAQKRKKEKGKGKEKEGDKDGKEKDEAQDKNEGAKSPSSSPGLATPPSSDMKTPPHEKYALHRHMFSLRIDEHRRRRQTKEMQNLAPRLPGAPTGSIG